MYNTATNELGINGAGVLLLVEVISVRLFSSGDQRHRAIRRDGVDLYLAVEGCLEAH